MKKSILLFALLLSGCASTGAFDNRLTTTPDCSRAFVISLYWKIGVASEINSEDVKPICQPS